MIKSDLRLGDLCEVKSSKRVFAKEYVDDGVPFFRSKDVIDKALGIFQKYDLFISFNRYKELKEKTGSPQKCDLLINSVGNRTGHSYVVKDEGEFYFKDGNILWLSNFNELDPHFLSYWLKSSKGQNILASVMIGSAQKALTIEAVKNLKIPNLKIENQVMIVSILGALDHKIENNRQMNKTLEDTAVAIFKSWFVDFDPVHAKTVGKTPVHMDADIASMFPDSFGDDSLPIGWNEISFGKLVQPKKGKIITKKTAKSGEFPVVAGGVKPAYYHNLYNAKSPVVTISASGNAGFVNIYYSNIWASDCSFINSEITKYVYFSHCFLKFNQKKLFDMQHGAVQQHIYPNDIMRLSIKIGSNHILDKFEQTVSHFYERIALNLEENKTLTELRDNLLPKLMSGEIRVKDAEREMGAAL